MNDAIGRLGSVRQAGTDVQEKRVDVAYTGQQQSLTRYSDVGGTA